MRSDLKRVFGGVKRNGEGREGSWGLDNVIDLFLRGGGGYVD